MSINFKQLSVEKLAEVFQYSRDTSLSKAIILAALSINKPKNYLTIEKYRENVFSELWKKQFHHGKNWTAQFRSELNQGDNRLANRVFESPGNGFKYRIKKYEDLSTDDLKIVKTLKQKIEYLEKSVYTQNNADEDVFQTTAQIADPIKLPAGKIKKPKKKKRGKYSQYDRDPRQSKQALLDASYKCQYDTSHITFLNPLTENNFVEAHHVIPMEYQEKYPYSIDVTENIAPLCPNCHRKMHKAAYEAKREMLEKLLTEKRIEGLRARDIDITLEKVLDCYKNI